MSHDHTSSHAKDGNQAGESPAGAADGARAGGALEAAGDAAVRRLLARLGIADGPAGARSVAAAKPGQAPKPVDDSEVEALTPRDQAVFEAKVAQAADSGLVSAVKSMGMVPFLKAIAAGKTVQGINEAKFEALWNNAVDEAWLKDRFRAVDPGMHEWIPSNEVEAVVQRAKSPAHPGGAAWIDLQNELRSDTSQVIFAPAKVNLTASEGGKPRQMLQGHVGALYFNGVMQTKEEAAFHDELRAAFASAGTIPDAVDKLKAVMAAWMWKGEPLPKPLPDKLQDSGGKPIDEKHMVSTRAAVFGQMSSLFDHIKAKFGAAGGK